MRQVRQMQLFIKAANPALHTVTSLDLTSCAWEAGCSCDGCSCGNDGVRDVTAIFWPLASVLPRLQLLKVSGDCEAVLLGEFGGACPALTSLEAVNLPVAALERLSELAPHVTSTRMTLFHPDDDDDGDDHEGESGVIEPYRNAIRSCHTLVSLDVGQHALSAEDWRSLPCSLQQLSLAIPDSRDDTPDLGPPFGVTLPNLEEVLSSAGANVSLDLLANLMRAAPNLQHLDVCCIWLTCSLAYIPDLKLVDQRLAAGFRLQSVSGHGVQLEIYDTEDAAVSASIFASQLPVLEQFRSVRYELAEHLCSDMTRAFPRLQLLTVISPIDSSIFLHLAAFPLLRELELLDRPRASLLELGALCWQLPSLRYFGVVLSDSDEQALAAVLKFWGSKVSVNALL